ncbi:phosphonate ABC transporter ATP-binding protein [Paenibacillus chartarius]|uniref:Phosphonate ABC transporter ATP-binding protein n=1 Tax=Paenibacillus chartarius TaxID=747481 RepID=A0ABV6DVR8_9BACL
MIIARNITKTYKPDPKEVLSKVSLQIDDGEFVAIVGGSGSGKTTLLRCLSLQDEWDSGQLIVNGKDAGKLGSIGKWGVRRRWVFIEEKPTLDLHATALKNVARSLLFHSPIRAVAGLVSKNEHMEAMDYLERVGLLDKAHQKAGQLSGGERQRIAVAKALVQGATMIFADEPVSGLDPTSAESVMRDLKAIGKREQITIVATLHRLDLAERYATRILGVREGRVVVDIPGRALDERERGLIFG